MDAWGEFRVSLVFGDVAGNPGRGGRWGNLEGEIQSEGGGGSFQFGAGIRDNQQNQWGGIIVPSSQSNISDRQLYCTVQYSDGRHLNCTQI